MTTLALEIVKEITTEIPNIIDISGYKNEYIARKVGMKPQYFSVKKQRNKFNFDEVEKILNVITNTDVEDYLTLIELRARNQDENVTLAELKQEMGWK